MLRRGAITLCMLAMLAGCAEPEASEGDLAPAAAGPTTTGDTGSPNEALPAANASTALAISLNGSTGTQAVVCAEATPSCMYREVVGGTSDIFFQGLVGRLAAGTISLEWTAASPATRELAFGIMIMGGSGEACAPVVLGIARGASPLTIGVTPAERAFCPDDALHVWASNGIYVGDAPNYVQLDVDQPFRLTGSVEILPPSAP